jgi:hypothetical protein
LRKSVEVSAIDEFDVVELVDVVDVADVEVEDDPVVADDTVMTKLSSPRVVRRNAFEQSWS